MCSRGCVLQTQAPTENPKTRWSLVREGDALRLAGELTVDDAAAIWRDLRGAVDAEEKRPLTIDLSKVKVIDGAVMALVVELRADLAARKVPVEIVGANARIEALANLYGGHDGPTKRKKRRPESALAQVGMATLEVGAELKAVLGFFGSLVIAGVKLVRNPRRGHWKEVPVLVEKAGAEAVFIVVLINFLVGFVMAYQSAKQLKMFGANIYVADLVGISMTRELAPLMTAIIVCGRSGAGFIAELGSMKVGEEIDALRTIGLVPFGWLVVPRVIALLVVVPILTLVGDLVGIAGGAVVAVTSLDLTLTGYVSETRKAVQMLDLETGLLKSFVFGLAIALIACQKGFATSGGAEGVGRRTTSTVVTSLFALVIIDAVFTVVFRMLDL